MKVIFVTIAYPQAATDSNLYTDLMDEFIFGGHQVYVVSSTEKRYGAATNLSEINGIQVLRVKTGNIKFNPNYISKGLALLQLQSQFIHAIDQFFSQINFDLILYSTPPVQYNRIISYLKRKSNAVTYLLLKDIFPQNALDMGLLSKWNPVYWYFRIQEKKTYQLSDFIGCMSPANVNYLLKHNPTLTSTKVDVCANSLKDRGKLKEHDRIAIRSKVRRSFAIKEDELLITYGGNLGIAQGLSFLLEIIKAYANNQKIKFLIVGQGTWFSRIGKFVTKEIIKNVIVLQRVPTAEFKEMLIASDIGLIFLNPRFTIPNFPSRLVSYLEIGLPVITCTDTVSDIGDVVADAGCGYKVISGDVSGFDNAIKNLTPEILNEKSVNARNLFENSYTTKNAYAVIMNKLKN